MLGEKISHYYTNATPYTKQIRILHKKEIMVQSHLL